LINKYEKLDYPGQIEKNKIMNKQEMNTYFEKLLLVLDKTSDEENYNGLPIYNKIFYLTEDNYQNQYNIFIDSISETTEKKNIYVFDYKPIESLFNLNEIVDLNEESQKCYSYLKKIYHLVKTLFGNMKNYNCNNFTYYKYYETPNIFSLNTFLDKNPNLSFEKEILRENVTSDNYFNSLNHYIIITPVCKFNLEELNNLVNSINIENLWYSNQENFKFKDFDIVEFFKIYRNNLNNLPKYELLNKEVFLIGFET
jgi:hypothetical protein